MRHWRVLGCLALGITVLSAGATRAFSADLDGVVHVGGDVPLPGDWSVSRIDKELAADIKVVQYASHGEKHSAHCVPLLSVLGAAGVETELKMDPKADPKGKNANLRLVVVVEASDGYVVAFSLAELLADVGNRHVWLALDADGQPLAARDGPVRLIVPEDAMPARWVHAVQTIDVVDGAAATTQPAGQ